jgi:hypothetical protein
MFHGVFSCNVVIIPPEEIRQAAIEISQRIAAHGSHMTLNAISAIPHITIHQFAFPSQNILAVDEAINRAAWGRKPFQLTLAKVSEYPGNAIFWDVDMNDMLMGLHSQLVKDVNNLRDGYITELHPACLTGPVDIGADRRKNLAKWGNPLTLGTFLPHLTLSVLADSKLMSTAMSIASQLQGMTFQVDAIYMATLGPRGTCPAMPEKSFSLDG